MYRNSPLSSTLLWLLCGALILLGGLLLWWGGQDLGIALSASSNDLEQRASLTLQPDTEPGAEVEEALVLPTTPPTTSPATIPTAPAPPVRLALPSSVPPDLEASLLAWLKQQPNGTVISDSQQADLWLTSDITGEPLVERYYVPVGRFATLEEEIDPPELLSFWLGIPGDGAQPLALEPDAAAAMTLLFGEPAQVEVLADGAAIADALEPYPARRGVVAFDRLVPRLKALAINGQNPIENSFDPDSYLLTVRLYLDHRPEATTMAESLRAYMAQEGLATNRDPDKLTVLVQTGVTAMSRMTALRMEQQGYDYPARVISPELAAADLTHISNEVPFVEECQVNASENNITLCSKPEYMEALRAVGVDLVGLTGNHLNDYGKEASLESLQFYQEQELPTFGGGANREEAQRPLVIEHNGNRLVFLGANYFGPELAWADADWPGSAPYDTAAMTSTIASAREDPAADLVVVDLQWEESYDTLPIVSQRTGFRELSAAGADIVTGVQSHVPQAVEFGEGGLILYGLGNLFFDQMWSLPTRQGLIPRHTIYDGRHLSTQLLTTILEDFAQPRWTTDSERELLLRQLFTASGW